MTALWLVVTLVIFALALALVAEPDRDPSGDAEEGAASRTGPRATP